jgi:hypothetical protein
MDVKRVATAQEPANLRKGDLSFRKEDGNKSPDKKRRAEPRYGTNEDQ